MERKLCSSLFALVLCLVIILSFAIAVQADVSISRSGWHGEWSDCSAFLDNEGFVATADTLAKGTGMAAGEWIAMFNNNGTAAIKVDGDHVTCYTKSNP